MTEGDHEIHDNSDIMDVYETSSPNHRALGKAANDYCAWHHPRKQWVRVNQWCAAVRSLLNDLGLSENTSFNYLTLPGNELLDIRALHDVFARKKRKLRYLGFNAVGRNTDAQSELSLSRNEVSSLPWIHQFSYVEEDRLETIINAKSPGHSRVIDVGYFHAINFDLCDSIARRDPKDVNGSALGALEAIIQLQVQNVSPWLLFVTTKIEPGLISDRVKQGFESAISGNIDRSDEFATHFEEAVGIADGDEPKVREQAWATSGDALVRLFATGLGKWLLGLLCTAKPPRRLRLLSACIYKSGHTTNMLSIAFRCDTTPTEVNDRHGIFDGKNQQADVDVNEIELGVELAQAMRGCFDLDTMLADNPEVAEKLIGQAAKLMSGARYDPDAYSEWARQQIQSVA